MPALNAPLTKQLVAWTFLIGIALLSGLGRADESPRNNTDTGKPFATTWRIQGQVFAGSTASPQRELKIGDIIHVGERIRSAQNGEAVFKVADGGLLAIRPHSEFVAERFAAEKKPTDRQILRLFIGSLRVVSGWISHFNRAEHRILAPSASIGIRGTDYEPYVLPPEQASPSNLPGTYDKVNRGATTLEAHGGELAVNPGQVGFALDPKHPGAHTRALITLLLPTLLDRTPDIFISGKFDAEIDRYSAKMAAAPDRKAMTNKVNHAPIPRQRTAAFAADLDTPPAGCSPQAVGHYWLGRLDRGMAQRDVKTILALFSTDMVARATVRDRDNRTSTQTFSRDEMVASTLKSLASLEDYSQRRLNVETRALEAAPTDSSDCPDIEIHSDVVEQGRLGKQAYRFESTETYRLEKRNGEWLAIEASSTQR